MEHAVIYIYINSIEDSVCYNYTYDIIFKIPATPHPPKNLGLHLTYRL